MTSSIASKYRLPILVGICILAGIPLILRNFDHGEEPPPYKVASRPPYHAEPLPFELKAQPLKKPLLENVPGPLRDKMIIEAGPDTAAMRKSLFGMRDFERMEREAQAIRTGIADPERRAEELRVQTVALSEILWRRDTTGMRQTLEAWVREKPGSALARNVLASFYKNHAWDHRGHGYADDVDEESWGPFYDLLAKAKVQTEHAITLEPENPQPHFRRLLIDMADGTTPAIREAHYREAVIIAPWSFQVRSVKLKYLQPRWHGGEGEEMFAFAMECLKDTVINPRFKRILIDAYQDALSDYNPRDKKLPTVEQARMLGECNRLWKELTDKYPEDLGLQLDYLMFTKDFHLSKPFLEVVARVGTRWKPGAWKTVEGYLYSCANMYFIAALNAPAEEAIPYLQRAVLLNRDTTWINPNYKLGRHLLSIGDYAGAETQLKLALAGKPSYKCEVLAYLSMINAQVKNDTAEAVRYARQIFADMPVEDARTWAVTYLDRLGARPESPATGQGSTLE